MANCLYLHDSYITKFDFMIYAFAKLVVAWLNKFDCQFQIVNDMVQSWKEYPTGEQLPVYANMFRLACKAVGITMFGDHYRDDKNVEEFQKLYTVVHTNLKPNKSMKNSNLLICSKDSWRCIKYLTHISILFYNMDIDKNTDPD